MAALLAVIAVAIWLRIIELDGSAGYDEGVNGAQLRLMSSGHTLYREIYGTQGPLFLPALFPFFQWGGRTLEAARIGSVFWSLLGLAGAGLIGWIGAGRAGAMASLTVLTLSPMYLAQSRVIQSEAAAFGPAALSAGLALAYLRYGHLRWLALSSLCLTVSVLIKPLTISAVIVLLMAVSLQPHRAPSVRLRQLWIAAIAPTALLLGVAAVLGPGQIWEQLVQFHLVAKDVAPLNIGRNLEVIRRGTQSEWPLLLGAALLGGMGLVQAQPRIALALIGWALATLILLVTHTPLFGHHVSALALPAAGLAAGVSPIFTRLHSPPSRLSAALVALCFGAWICLQSVPALLAVSRGLPRQSALIETATVLRRLSSPADYVLTDHPAVALEADRQVVPELADLSRVRVTSGLLAASDALTDIQLRQPRIAIIWFEYLQESLPELVAEIKQRYTPVWATEDSRYIAVAGNGLDLPKQYLDHYREARDLNFSGGLSISHLRHPRAIPAGGTLDLYVLWNVSMPLVDDYSLRLIARSADGASITETSIPLGAGWNPTSRWNAPARMASYVGLSMDEHLNKGSYRLLVEIQGPSGSLRGPVRRSRGEETEISSFDVE
ncbi:MAG: ArnT family glycosyltransferase [Chloroflexota bacterium]